MIKCDGTEVTIGVSTYNAIDASAEVMSDLTRILKAGRNWLTSNAGLKNEYVNELFMHALIYSDMSDEELEKASKEDDKNGKPV